MTPSNTGGSSLYEVMKSIPGGVITLISILAVFMVGFLYIKFNVKILAWLGKVGQKIGTKVLGGVGKQVSVVNKRFKRSAELNINSITFRIYRYFDDIIVNTGLHRQGVSVAGLLFFISFASVLSTLITMFAFDLNFLAIPALGVFFALYIILFRYVATTRIEKNEEMIMDAVDLLVSDIRGGVFNAIIKYRDSFHADIRPFFIECIDNVQNKGYSFETAMQILNDQLGYAFSDFATKAIYYEANRQDGTEGIFGAIIEMNRQRRILRRENAEAFNSLKMGLMVSFIAIGLFAAYTIFNEAFIRDFLVESILGRLMIIADVGVIAFVFGRLTTIRARMI